MTSTHHARVKEIFLQAIELDADQRAAWLDRTCGDDDALRRDVESLLDHHVVETILTDTAVRMPTIVDRPEAGRVPVSATSRIPLGRLSAGLFGTRGRLAISLLLLIVAVGGIGVWTHHLVKQSLRDVVGQQLRTLLDANVLALQGWIDQRKVEAVAWAEDPRLRTLVNELVAAAREGSPQSLRQAPAQAALNELLQPYLHERNSAAYTLIDLSGTILASNYPSGIGAQLNVAESAYLAAVFRGATKFARPYPEDDWITDPPEIVYDRPIDWVDTPVRDTDGTVIASLGFGKFADEDFSAILSVARMGNTGETFAFDQQGLMLSESRFARQLHELGLLEPHQPPRAILNIWIRDPGVNLTRGHKPKADKASFPPTRLAAAVVASRGAEHPVERRGIILDAYRSYRGAHVIGAWQWLADHEFALATEVEIIEADAPLLYLQTSMVILLGLLTVCLAAVVLSSLTVVRLRHQVGEAMQLGQYTLARLIGEGGMGKVYLARHALLKRPTAIKMIRKDAVSQDNLARFEREVQLASLLTHPNTIEIYDYGRTPDGVFYYAMEFLAGFTLAELVARDGRQPAARVIHILWQVCGSLREAHGLGLIHRDIKPQNIMLCCRGGAHDVVKVLDFGLAKPAAELEATRLTGAEQVLGTPLYMAPERYRDPGSVDLRADIFAVGGVAYYLLTGKPAFEGTDYADIIHNVLRTEPANLAAAAAGIPRELEELVTACLAKEPDQRPRDSQAVLDVLASLRQREVWNEQLAIDWWHQFGDTQSLALSGTWRD